MSKPYALVSDVHCHSWSQFSKAGPDGVNSRLRIILDELVRAAETVKVAGGDTLRVAGDLFHVRGKIEPSVFNPTFDTFTQIAGMGVKIEIIPGNHDLEGANADRLGNAMQQLEQIAGVSVVVEPEILDGAVMIPWIEDLEELKRVATNPSHPDKDLIIHAPLNGVIRGIPDLGLDPADLATWGYRRVLVGHYHNHKEFVGGVYSIGATSHQTWSDPGTLAGFLMLYHDRVEHVESLAPKFVNIDDVGQITPAAIKGNYCRLRLVDADPDVLENAKKEIDAAGALDWVDHSSKKRTTIRPQSASSNNVTLEVSVANYVDSHLDVGKLDKTRIQKDALAVLTEARTVGDE